MRHNTDIKTHILRSKNNIFVREWLITKHWLMNTKYHHSLALTCRVISPVLSTQHCWELSQGSGASSSGYPWLFLLAWELHTLVSPRMTPMTQSVSSAAPPQTVVFLSCSLTSHKLESSECQNISSCHPVDVWLIIYHPWHTILIYWYSNK